MRYKLKGRIKALIAAGLLALNVSGCNKEIQGYRNTLNQNTINDNEDKTNEYENSTEFLIEETTEYESNTEFSTEDEATEYESSTEFYIDEKEVEQFREKMQSNFSTNDVTLDKSCDEFITNIFIDGTDVSIELVDGSIVSGTIYNLEISDMNFEKFYIYDSKYINDLFNVDTVYQDYEENGYDSPVRALRDDYDKHEKLNLETSQCYVSEEYKKGEMEDINWYDDVDYFNCKNIWIYDAHLERDFLEEISLMPNLETLILTNPYFYSSDEEKISIHSNSLKNIIIDVEFLEWIDQFDFTRCPNLESVSISGDTQETNLNGLKGLRNLKQLSFGLPLRRYNIDELILKEFQDRIDMISNEIPIDDISLSYSSNCIISDISAINGSNIETLNVSFLKNISSDMLLETVKSLPNLKKIVGFEVNNAGMCSDELIRYCEENGILHPFTEKSLEIKHKLQEIVANSLTEEMDEEEKIKKLSEYIVSHMEYDDDLIVNPEKSATKIKKGWVEALYYSVIKGEGVCEGYTIYAQNLFTEAGIKSFKVDELGHTWNLIQIDDEYYMIDLTFIDEVVDEKSSSSFDNYDLEAYYLVPIEDVKSYNIFMLPIRAEEKYNEAKERREAEETEKIETKRTESYMIQTKKQDLNPKSYLKLCGIVGISSALGLAKKVVNKDKELNVLKREGVIKVHSLKDVLKALKRIQKNNELRRKREIADTERIINEKAKELERKANQMEQGESTR